MHRSDQVAEGLGGHRDDLHGALDVDFPGEPSSSLRTSSATSGRARVGDGDRSTSLSYCLPAVSA
jgi:hypothetical protein